MYRTLTTFEELQIVKKSSFKGEAARYKFNDHDLDLGHGHEHFFKCRECNIIEPFEGCIIDKKEKELRRKGYKNLTHHLEIIGTYPSCDAS